jgi:hypothetical protein
MHPEAAERMRQLVLEAIDDLVVAADHTLSMDSAVEVLRPLIDFFEKTFSEWVDDALAFLEVYTSTGDALQKAGLLAKPGPLKNVMSAAQRQEVAQTVCEHWSAVPISYEFTLPLPALAPFEAEIEIAPGVKLRDAPRHLVDAESMGLPQSLGALMQVVPAPPVPCLSVTGKGLLNFGHASAPAASAAIRRAKIVVQLGLVEEIFFTGSSRWRPPQTVTYEPRISLETIPLPAVLAGVLPQLKLRRPRREQQQANSQARWASVGTVLAREEQWDPRKRRPQRGSAEAIQAQIDQHCARIATSAEWLFDATHDQQSATTFVQTAIAFEALYGGAKDEPVMETLSNRVAYSLGTSPQNREQLIQMFLTFYSTRSRVVHSGATRLTAEQAQELGQAQWILNMALRHELRLVARGAAEIAEPAAAQG